MAQEREGSRLAGRMMLPDYDWTASTVGLKSVYTVVTYTRSDGTTYMVSTLSNPDANNNYQTDTWQFYDAAGTTVVETHTWTLTYDANSVQTKAVMA
ncbi:MAG: hypothetical protein KGL39_17595 [Patescibacteria group bacterium]|nr:hypothetical protein [Patescibacteria group bacterium]